MVKTSLLNNEKVALEYKTLLRVKKIKVYDKNHKIRWYRGFIRPYAYDFFSLEKSIYVRYKI